MIGVSVMKESKKIVLAVLRAHFFMNFVERYKCFFKIVGQRRHIICSFENIVQYNLISMQKSLLPSNC